MESQTKGHSKASQTPSNSAVSLREIYGRTPHQDLLDHQLDVYIYVLHPSTLLIISRSHSGIVLIVYRKEGISILVTLPFRKPRGVPILEKSRLGPNTHAGRVYLIQELPCHALVMSMKRKQGSARPGEK
ncbi:unnamed protein product [Clonostachys chloroleuca]|uniref:Uncharacterized protein n=1 Tax=Clonostachys chloroleuca TaxID=1926264 RepID=A0AA35Q4B8_9HYPO|nr:unnamed protein product [Clonostachys chloroleuca]